jgi:hypothetical protein
MNRTGFAIKRLGAVSRRAQKRREKLISIAWEKDIDAALVEARSSKRPLLVDFNATPM